jgi:hypothetical protein
VVYCIDLVEYSKDSFPKCYWPLDTPGIPHCFFRYPWYSWGILVVKKIPCGILVVHCGILVVHCGILVVHCGILVVSCGKKTHPAKSIMITDIYRVMSMEYPQRNFVLVFLNYSRIS